MNGEPTSNVGARIERNGDVLDVSVGDAIGDATEIDFTKAAGASVEIPTGSLLTALTWWHCKESGGTYLPCYDADGTTATAQTVQAPGSFPLPSTLYEKRFLKAIGTFSSGTVTETINICLKT
jgi:hypothetical protein